MGEPNWAELGVFISVCGSAVVALIFAMQKSSCDQISCCWGALRCHRPPEVLQAKAAAAAARGNRGGGQSGEEGV